MQLKYKLIVLLGVSQRKSIFSNVNDFGSKMLSFMDALQCTEFYCPDSQSYLVIIMNVKGSELILCNTLFLLKLRIFNVAGSDFCAT